MSSSNNYWEKRETEQAKHNIVDERLYAKEVEEIFKNMKDEISKEINNFYAKYANENGITMSEAKRRASSLDIEEYARKAKKYVKDKDLSDKANEEMKLYNMTMKVNRLEMLKANIGLKLIDGHSQLEKKLSSFLSKRASDTIKRQAGILGNTIRANENGVNSIINSSFHNATFSDRIWMHQDLLKSDLHKLLSTGLIQGKNPNVLAREIRKKFDSKKSDAERLMRTELARVQTESQKQSLLSAGFDEYEFLSLGNACDICRALNGKYFKLEKMMPGENAPPMHPYCRCSVAPHSDRRDYDQWLGYLESGGSAKEWQSLSENERYAINKYTGFPSYIINEALRNGTSLSKENQKIVNDLESALNKLHNYDGVLWRDVYFDNQEAISSYSKRYKVGEVVEEKQFISTSKKIGYNTDAQIRFRIINSKKATDISMFNEKEYEVLYNIGSKFKVIDVNYYNGITFITLEEHYE